MVVARELTKLHEEFLRGSAEELLAHFAEHPPRGEMVVLFNTRVRAIGSDGAAGATSLQAPVAR